VVALNWSSTLRLPPRRRHSTLGRGTLGPCRGNLGAARSGLPEVVPCSFVLLFLRCDVIRSGDRALGTQVYYWADALGWIVTITRVYIPFQTLLANVLGKHRLQVNEDDQL